MLNVNSLLISLLIVEDEKDLADIIAEIASEHFDKVYVCNEGPLFQDSCRVS